jgi:multiple sugar transport system permease protein
VAVAPDTLRPSRSRLRTWFGEQPIGYLFVAPFVLFLVGIYAYPFFFAVFISFYKYIFTAPGAQIDQPFAGLGNYAAVLSDPLFHIALRNVLIFLVINVPLTVAVSMILATALNGAIPLRGFFRAAYYIPYITASVAAVGIWLWLFSGSGLVNKILGPLAPNPSWLVNGFWAMPIIAIYVTWKGLGFYILLYLAALQAIPKELYEAAKVDGARRIGAFFAVTVPGLRPATVLVVVVSIITGANFFTEPYLLTGGGGPDNQSVSPVFLIYREGIEQNHPGYAAAIGILLAIGVLVVSGVSRFFLERE